MKKLLIIAALFITQAHAERVINLTDSSECFVVQTQLKNQGYRTIKNNVYVDASRYFTDNDTYHNGQQFVKVNCIRKTITAYSNEEFREFVNMQNNQEQARDRKVNQQLKDAGIL
jgi:hypothetical protein